DSLEAPIKKGQEIGKMMAVIDGKAVASVPIIATNDVAQSGFLSRTWQHIVRWAKNLF
ncbi:MAG: serine-type D-Ala-D-Ala carboxypeptidase, partial [Psychrobacter sp.]